MNIDSSLGHFPILKIVSIANYVLIEEFIGPFATFQLYIKKEKDPFLFTTEKEIPICHLVKKKFNGYFFIRMIFFFIILLVFSAAVSLSFNFFFLISYFPL